jgi:hypothetical protein
MATGLMDDAPRLTSPRQAVRCRNCGYGAVVRALPEACPMCRSSAWEPEVRRPFRHLHDVFDDDDGRGPTPAA